MDELFVILKMRAVIIAFLLIRCSCVASDAPPPSSYLFSKPSFNNRFIFIQSLQAETLPTHIRLHSCKWLVLDSKSLKPAWQASYPFQSQLELPMRHGSVVFDDGEHLAFFRTRLPPSSELAKQGKINILPDTELIRFFKRGKEVAAYSAKDLKLDLAKIERNSFPEIFVIRPIPDYTNRWSWLGQDDFWRKIEKEAKDPLKFSDFDGRHLTILFEDGTRVQFSREGKILMTEETQIKSLFDDLLESSNDTDK